MASQMVVLLCGVLGWAGAFWVLRFAQRLGLVHPPNDRSSHTVPTPAGGGAGMALAGTLAGGSIAGASAWPLWPAVIGGALIAAIGFADDQRGVPALVRLGAQIVLVAALVLLGPSLQLLAVRLGLPPVVPVLAAVLVLLGVYWVNLFNFMDGIDGLAASQAAFMAGGAGLIAYLVVPGVTQMPEFWWLLGIAAAAVGFLTLNWPPARIFMGDVGSTYLGFILFAMAMLTIAMGWLRAPAWAILAALFVADASVTLIRRALRRDNLFTAHRQHAYQVLSRRFGHRAVTLGFIVINLIFLLPLALLAEALPAWAWAITGLAYAPLLALAVLQGAERVTPHA